MKYDESSEVALNGMIKCQILDNDLDEAEKQLEFLQEIQSNIGMYLLISPYNNNNVPSSSRIFQSKTNNIN